MCYAVAKERVTSMKSVKLFAITTALAIVLTACGAPKSGAENPSAVDVDALLASAVEIVLSDSGINVGGAPVGTGEDESVSVANDIIYYEEGKDFTYGEGDAEDAHDEQTAAEHTVVHITRPGVYSVSGTLSKGQIAVDLGKEAKSDPNAVVTLLLNGVDITCQVAPAVIFYNVYECGTADTETATKDVDTSAAGANVVLVDGTTNTVNGSYVARIYKPDSVVLNADGTKVDEAKKLHKYDAAFYSKMTMNVAGGKENSGVLNIHAENEGLDSELHLTINGGNINIVSGNDGINTNEDGVSVTTVNAGKLNIRVTGETGEGDGIDSNGWLVINGGTVIAQACSFSADAGIDSDMGIHINGGTVIATGSMLDRIEAGGQNYAVFNFANRQSGSKTIQLNRESGSGVLEFTPDNDYSVLVYSSPDLTAGNYTLWSDGTQLAGAKGGSMGMGGMGMGRPGMQGMPGGMPQGRPEGMPVGEMPQGMPGGRPGGKNEGMQFPEGEWPSQRPEGMTPPTGDFPFGGQNGAERPERPEGQNDRNQWGGNRPEGQWGPNDGGNGFSRELNLIFEISDGGTMFQNVSEAK